MDTGNSFSWHRPLRRNPFICIYYGISEEHATSIKFIHLSAA
ncbi:MAG TPA: hypothetical protein PL045_07885 [Chitinophagaceae bacterium]|nr:hypothetical protein [Chitinophagaceae bacterium]